MAYDSGHDPCHQLIIIMPVAVEPSVFVIECRMYGRSALEFECAAARFDTTVSSTGDNVIVRGAPRACHCAHTVLSRSPTTGKLESICASAQYGYGWVMAQLQSSNVSVHITESGYDMSLQAPFFSYTAGSTQMHQVWYENAQSLSKVTKFPLFVAETEDRN